MNKSLTLPALALALVLAAPTSVQAEEEKETYIYSSYFYCKGGMLGPMDAELTEGRTYRLAVWAKIGRGKFTVEMTAPGVSRPPAESPDPTAPDPTASEDGHMVRCHYPLSDDHDRGTAA